MKGISCGVRIGFGLVWSPPESVSCKCQQDLGNLLLLPAAAAWGATACSCLVGSHLIFSCLSPCPSHECCSIILYLLITLFCPLSAFISPTGVELHVFHIRLVLGLWVCAAADIIGSLCLFVLVNHLPFTVKSSTKIL